MHQYIFHIKDYRAKTAHLSPMEHYIYRSLIDWYYLEEKPLPCDLQKIARLLMLTTNELQSLQNVLDEFFVIKKTKGNRCEYYHHKRIDKEVANYKYKQRIKSTNQSTNEVQTGTNQSTNQSTNKNSTDVKKEFFIKALRNQGVKCNTRMTIGKLQTLFDTHCKQTTNEVQTGTNDTNAILAPNNHKPLTINQELNNISPQTPQGEVSEHEQTQNLETTTSQTPNTSHAKKPSKPLNISFDEFWDLYDKKQDRPKCERLWSKLTDQERLDIMAYLPKYKQSQPDKKYRKHPQTFLNNRSWENEIIDSTSKPTWQQTPQFGGKDDPLAVNQHWQNYQPPANWQENFEKAMAMVSAPTSQPNTTNTMIEI